MGMAKQLYVFFLSIKRQDQNVANARPLSLKENKGYL